MTAAIDLAKKGLAIVLFEKNQYPHHKVCGEYLSREVAPYFEQLGIPFHELAPATISRLLFTTPCGAAIETDLPLGGFGISRFALDHLLYRKALELGVEVIHEIVTDIQYRGGDFKITADAKVYIGSYVLAAYGKRSGLDKQLKRPFFRKPASWLAVKAHYHHPFFPADLVALHNFRGGYCGLSRTESGAVNVCYLATYKSFKPYKDPAVFEKEVLQKNPYLREFFSESTSLFEQPLSIAQVSFDTKARVENHILFLGDAAGLIHPLCGNGMAMAIHSAKLVAELIFKHPRPSAAARIQLERDYSRRWDQNFKRRMQTGKLLQRILLNQKFAQLSQRLVSRVPFILPQIIKRTHGQSIS